jgi:hypothetical protein
MPKKSQDKDAALAETMLRDLESLKQEDSGAYPPKLAELARLSGQSPSDEQVQKAANKKTFTAKAVVIEKVNKKPSLDSPVYIKGDEPAKKKALKRAPVKPKPKLDESELAQRMLRVLESQRRLGTEAYPPLLRRIAELCELEASNTRVTKAASHSVFTGRAIVAAKAKNKPNLDAPVVLREDVDRAVPAILSPLLRFSLAPVTTRPKGKPTETAAFTRDEATKRVVPELQKTVSSALDPETVSNDLPSDVAWVMSKGKPLFFLVENVRPSSQHRAKAIEGHVSTPRAIVEKPQGSVRDFAQAFREAFDQLDRRNGFTNFVKLADLRKAVSAFGREEFDAGLQELRLAREFSLDSHEGLHGSLTPEEREAGVREAGSLLIYASRR